MAHPVANTFREAAELVAGDACRQGNCLGFRAGEEILYTGDIHGNRRNLAKVVSFADLGAHPDRRLILQELIHGGPATTEGGDRSVELLLRAARMKITYPERVFFLLGNHDLAQFTGSEITKSGGGMCKAFDQGLDHAFGEAAGEVRRAVNDLLAALPLAGRCEGGVFMSHSLPGPGRMRLVDWDILSRPYAEDDLGRGGTVYEWTWGRGHTPEQLAELGERLNASFFLIGHQPVETGYEIVHGRAAIIASEGPHGVVLCFDAGEGLDGQSASLRVRPIVAM